VPAATELNPRYINHKDVEMRSPVFALGVCLSVATGLITQVAAAEVTAASIWKTDFAAAQAEAKKLHRPIVVHFGAKWCGPCRKMEREVLDTPQVLKLLDAGFVAVKLDFDIKANEPIRTKYGAKNLPTDVILDPDGKVLVKTEGYETGDRAKYIANVTRIETRYAAERAKIARTAAPAETPAAKPVAEKQPLVAAQKSIPQISPSTGGKGDKLVPPPTEPKKIGDVASAASPDDVPHVDQQPAAAPATEAAQFLLGLDGYCPVTLRSTRSWKSGSSDITLEHDGQTFYFTTADKRDEFKAHPDRYAPRLLGCDPVILAENDLAVRGSVKFGAFYEGELFLFETADSRVKFRKNPTRYSRLQHVVKPEDVKKIASTSGD
jgi:thiol-disulfide isomerase/thioredoxin/YHS domain-containing protein